MFHLIRPSVATLEHLLLKEKARNIVGEGLAPPNNKTDTGRGMSPPAGVFCLVQIFHASAMMRRMTFSQRTRS